MNSLIVLYSIIYKISMVIFIVNALTMLQIELSYSSLGVFLISGYRV